MLAIAAAMTLPAYAYISPTRRVEIRDSLENRLSMARTSQDSMPILYNLYDLQVGAAASASYAERLFRTAGNAGNNTARMEALRMLTQVNVPGVDNDSMRAIQVHRAEILPVSDTQRETVTFIRQVRLQNRIRDLDESQRLDLLHNKLAEFDTDEKADIYRRIEMLFTICIFLHNRANSPLLLDYLEKLKGMIDRLPTEPGALKSLYYNLAGRANTAAGHYQAAVKSDTEYLQFVDSLQQRYVRKGRPLREYTIYYYTIYQRILGNYKALTPAQVKEVYGKLKKLAADEPMVAGDMARLGITESYYAMARGEYARAVPLLQYSLKGVESPSREINLLRLLIEAAKASHNDKALLEAYQRYTPIIEHQNLAVDADRIIEHEILHDVNYLQANNKQLESRNARMRDGQHRTILISGIVLLVVLGVAMIMLSVAYRRRKRIADNLSATNAALKAESANLKKAQAELIEARDEARRAEREINEFITTVSHEIADPVEAMVGYSQLIVDSIDDKRRGALDGFVKIIETNAQMIRTLVNDILDTAELENREVTVRNKRLEMRQLAGVAVDSHSSNLSPDIKLSYEPLPGTPADVTIDTDPSRVEQILGNLVSNALKFTEKGFVTVKYGILPDSRPVFIVEDSGPGIPPEKRPIIFDRFVKLNSTMPGVGLGLYICKMVADLIGATVELDDDYEDGTRMVLTLAVPPVNIK